MANKKISALDPATLPLSGDELVPIVQSGVTRRTTAAVLSSFAGPIVEVFVSQANGNNANDGLTDATPIADVQTFIDRYPQGAPFGVIFHLDSGNHLEFRLLEGWGKRGSVWFFGDGAGQAGDDGFVEVRASEAALAFSTEGMIVTSGSVTTALITDTVEVLSGVATGAVRHINRVDGDNLYVGRDIAGFLPGDSFRVVTPGAVVQLTTTTIIASGIGNGSLTAVTLMQPDVERCLGLVNLKLDDTGAGLGTSLAGCTVLAFGVDIGTLALNNSAVYSAPQLLGAFVETPWADALPYIIQASASNPATEAALLLRWTGWGITVPATTFLGDFLGYLTQAPGVRSKVLAAKVDLQGGGGGVYGSYRAHVAVAALSDSTWYALAGFTQSVFLIEGGDSMMQLGANIDVESSGETIQLIRGGTVFITAGTYRSTGTWCATVNVGTLETASGGGLVLEGSNPGVNDINIGTGTDYSLADLSIAGPFSNGPSFAVNE